MKISSVGIDLIKYFESLHDGNLSLIGLQPKLCPANIWTEGYGHAIRDDRGILIKGVENKKLAYSFSKIKDKSEAEAMLRSDITEFEKIVLRGIKKPMEQHQFDALVSHTYNTGGSQTLFSFINADRMDIKIEMLEDWWTQKYITANGKKLNGLVKRRYCEWVLFSTGILKLD